MRRKVPVAAVFWTFALAVPFTVLALAGVAYIDLHFSEIAQAIAAFEQGTSVTGRGWLAEFSARLPEVAGMLIGMVVILTIYLFVRTPARSIDQKRK
jgi:hypothetical protein